MATGTGKTIVMGMLITWHVLNRVAYPNDKRFSKNFVIIAPGLTVKKRLEVLYPYMENNVYTTRVAEYTRKSHVSHAVVDSNFERFTVFELEINPNVKSWVKNDHLGFDVAYVYQGIVHKYWPDFLIKLKSDLMVILEIKGQDTEKDRTKREYLDEWVKAINEDGRFGEWTWDVAFKQSDVKGIIAKIVKLRSLIK